jgi:K+-transporting ATPase ATPase C chain
MHRQLIISLKIFVLMVVITGILYPLLITGIAKMFFNSKANGSLVLQNNEIIGSELIGQKFDSLTYFWSRPSATDYNTLPSGGSNLGPTSAKLMSLVSDRKRLFMKYNGISAASEIPSEMVFASASGLDPHITPEAALLQVDRIVKYRRFSEEQQRKVVDLITNLTEDPQFHLFGQERINVFLLNLSLDKIK